MEKYTFKFNSSTALEALQAGKYDPIDFYQARLDLFNLSIMADYDQLICLPTLTAIDKYWYQIEPARISKFVRESLSSFDSEERRYSLKTW